jgi:ribosomal protein S12 methylthiotransferase
MEQIDEQIKIDRYDILMRDQLVINEENNEKKLNTVIKVLCEGYDSIGETYYGRSSADAPDIDGKIYFTGKKGILPGTFVDVMISEVVEYDLCGEAVKIY